MERGRYPGVAIFVVAVSALSLAQNALAHRWGLAGGDVALGSVGVAVLWRHRPRPTVDQYMGLARLVADKTPWERAQALLESHLSPAQLDELHFHARFTVHGSDGKTYVISSTWHHNVLCGGHRFCAGPDPCAAVPLADQLLAQKLLIETNAKLFRKVAYRSSVFTF